ncbi:hypothetical protein T440DRAFT_482634 [Plenodomus tracheiphilus IPT5]|uniref:Uncharacterized protein n=1 Tax=Plenodomus tracheiphilus IPT5 TaxID=1408161 RepID=A0A6A7AVW7_9PLEO|nr:hypothetical protein T440DRAFT_482634 [Plenodomus tracheiphilus IPT5]
MADNNETTLVICFGIFTLLTTIPGLHYRDSLCCLVCRSLVRAWYIDPDIDIEAVAGVQHAGRRRSLNENDLIVELQPRRSLPLYFDGATIVPDRHENTGGVSTTAPLARGD